ncbi:AraC family transcriptional regulator [Litoribaculum gwangyangense]|uniref:AraC family transcriptional regulator n=1 Tax=Litoribaculum gwangyangense TaxID=1130722 RepID=A0ABP9CZF0_9FLAO
MKVLPFKIPKPEPDAFVFQIDNDITFFDKLHQHEEIQISFIVEGEGTLIVGDRVNYYKKDDIIVLGSNIPHVFKSDLNTSTNSKMLSLFFTQISFGKSFFELEELKEIQTFFKRSKQGFKLTSKNKLAKKLFLDLEKSTKLEKLLILLQLLKIGSKCNYKNLSSYIYDKKYSDNEGYRIRNVFEYTMNNFEKEISLQTIAGIANMTKNAFCKYFKKRTNKTYIQFLTELRIENACNLLIKNKEISIAEVAEHCGYNNISNFNRQFQIYKKESPSKYRKMNI